LNGLMQCQHTFKKLKLCLNGRIDGVSFAAQKKCQWQPIKTILFNPKEDSKTRPIYGAGDTRRSKR